MHKFLFMNIVDIDGKKIEVTDISEAIKCFQPCNTKTKYTMLIGKVHLRMPAEDSLFTIAFAQQRHAERVSIGLPENEKSGIQIIYDFKKEYKREVKTYDQYTLKPIKTNNSSELSWQQANTGEKMLRLNGEIHFGSLFGIISKIPVFLGCLLAASLPITGFYIWWGRHNRFKRLVKL